MKKYPSALENLIEAFSKLPSVGKKTAERYALYVFSKMPEEDIIDFSNSLISLHKDITVCPCCGNISEGGLCNICSDESRDKSQILVVESIKDLYKIESVGEYNGIYQVLNGVISFSKGIGIESLNLDSLLEKVKNGSVKEIILATNATLEGETTARYIRELLNDYDVKITRLAHGLPVGGDLSYSDEMTILKAFQGRRDY